LKTKAPVFRTPLGNYTLKESIGQGGAGIVFRAIDEDAQEHALKHLRPNAQSSRRTKRFKNELAFCAKSSHPNIISIEDWGLTEIGGIEVPFYIMPLFPQTFRTLINNGGNTDTLLQVFLQVLDGVEAAHKAGVWHRDLKPENILFDPALSRAVVTDFGIAHFPDELLNTMIETAPRERLANFRYAAPEQRSNGTVDARADIYALGLMLYEMLTGELLQGTQHKKIGAIYPELEFLDPVVEHMLCQNPDDRLSTIDDVRSAITKQASSKLAKVGEKGISVSENRLKDVGKPAPVAYARYETTGKNAVRAEVYVRPSLEKEHWFIYEDSFGESRHEPEQEAAMSLVATDRRLINEGYIRMNYANLSGTRTFDL
jgi:serine/threonine protein kinase